jgi:hypothetical protein
MAAKLGRHLSADVRHGFAVGKRDDATAEVILDHFDGCPTCGWAVAATSGDDSSTVFARRTALGAPPPPETPSCPNPLARGRGRGAFGIDTKRDDVSVMT